MDWGVIIHIASIVLGALSAGIPILIKWNNARKAKNNAVTDAEAKQAQLEMLEMANAFIQTAETTFSAFDTVMKAQHSGTAGALKKENVLTRLQAFALSKGFEFDSEFWSAKIDEIVSFTKSVNSKK